MNRDEWYEQEWHTRYPDVYCDRDEAESGLGTLVWSLSKTVDDRYFRFSPERSNANESMGYFCIRTDKVNVEYRGDVPYVERLFINPMQPTEAECTLFELDHGFEYLIKPVD